VAQRRAIQLGANWTRTSQVARTRTPLCCLPSGSTVRQIRSQSHRGQNADELCQPEREQEPPVSRQKGAFIVTTPVEGNDRTVNPGDLVKAKVLVTTQA
jgi:hypothetical protein